MPRVGNIIDGKYRLLEVVGEGSMGAVWKARHETLGKTFAVKFLKDYQDETSCLRERFFSEARISAAVRHRSVIDVLDCGTTDEGTPYMVMEYLEGECLALRLERDPPMPVDELLEVMIAALAGLEAVHQAGILHRDLKPENIVLCPDGDVLIPKLVDFGISRVLETGTRRLTFPGTTLGTPWYMAPEQAQALHGMDQRADIYAFGVVLYEALTGALPFEHDSIQMLLLLVAVGGAPPLHTLRPDLPRALSDVIARAMDADPAERFASAAQLALALRATAAQVPATAVCQRRGHPLRPSQVRPPELPPPAPAATASRSPTLPLALARLGLARMPPRSVLLGAGVLSATGGLALFLFMHFGEAKATAEVARAVPSAVLLMPPPVRPAPVVPTAATTGPPEAPKLRRARRRPPEIFRDPGF